MIFEKYLLPDEMPENFECVTPERLLSLGKRYIICDIDNTLATYDDATPPENVRAWCESMNSAGIAVAFVSNNDHERVELFNRDFGYVAYANAGKPGTKKLRFAMRDLGATAENAAFLGDQLLTDAACAKFAGLYCFIVPPIKDRTGAFFRFKRWIEKPYVNKFKKNEVNDHE